VRQNFTGNGKVLSVTVREALWDIAVEQYGYVTTRNAHDLGIPTVELGKLAARGRLQRVSQGLYRFAEWPVSANDALMEAVLWTRDPRAALSHDTALEAYDLSDINPDKIHVTIPVREKTLRRRDMRASLVVHYENLADDQIGWWESIPAVTVATAIDQCIASQVRPDLVLQAIDAARRQGRIDQATAGRQRRQVRGDRR
jgi:predicted transcriptional regulator of viral defense system